ncbi:hypothetical protein ACKAWY_15305, partial [Xanthomonas vasicola pv. vasculorum]|uniref:hypothetical protein n=1 Tax=Xanthomonas vasicola TaxID=56459 RepID=UPI001C53E37D
ARIAQLLVKAADHAGQHRVGFAARHHDGRDQGRTRAQRCDRKVTDAGILAGHQPSAAGTFVPTR